MMYNSFEEVVNDFNYLKIKNPEIIAEINSENIFVHYNEFKNNFLKKYVEEDFVSKNEITIDSIETMLEDIIYDLYKVYYHYRTIKEKNKNNEKVLIVLKSIYLFVYMTMARIEILMGVIGKTVSDRIKRLIDSPNTLLFSENVGARIDGKLDYVACTKTFINNVVDAFKFVKNK